MNSILVKQSKYDIVDYNRQLCLLKNWYIGDERKDQIFKVTLSLKAFKLNSGFSIKIIDVYR